mmetsp:Transcript_15458/g.34103  ORF Transcript_15458/g.34103 Transcript_15458/m.34103 type:complete len:211 (-) Transcript_15458:1269-1901(-)
MAAPSTIVWASLDLASAAGCRGGAAWSASNMLSLQSSRMGRRKDISSVPPVPLPPALSSSFPFLGSVGLPATSALASVVVAEGAVARVEAGVEAGTAAAAVGFLRCCASIYSATMFICALRKSRRHATAASYACTTARAACASSSSLLTLLLLPPRTTVLASLSVLCAEVRPLENLSSSPACASTPVVASGVPGTSPSFRRPYLCICAIT